MFEIFQKHKNIFDWKNQDSSIHVRHEAGTIRNLSEGFSTRILTGYEDTYRKKS